MRKLTTEEFIAKAREVHGDKYDYSKVNYVDAKTKMEIICPEHGSFKQRPSDHLRGQGCKQCAIEQVANTQRSSNEEFIAKAKKVHGDKYDYSKVNYVGSKTEVEIICPIHGSFPQKPSDHLSGRGCKQCGIKQRANTKRSSNEEFIAKAREVHGDKYDYSRVNYVDANTKVEIICPEHGSFWQTPTNHLKGTGCPSCVGKKKYTTEEFIKRAKEKHGTKYDYSKVRYVNNQTKVEIICPKHGSFWQKPTKHLKGNGCPSCSGNIKLTTEEFIAKAREVHGNKYDYSKVRYVNKEIKVEILCPEHGSFWQKPANHINGAGCPSCYGNIKLTTEEFIAKAKAVHGNKYDYSKVVYNGNKQNIEIICPTHGSFWQTPSGHLRGRGCPYCGYKTNILKKDYIRLLKELQRSDLDLMDDAQLIMLRYDLGYKQCMPLLNTAKSQRSETLSKLLSKLEGEDDEQFVEDDEKTPDTKIAEGSISDILSGVTTDDTDDAESVRKLQDGISRFSSIRMDGEISFEDYKKFCFPNVPKHVFRREVARTWNVFIFPNEGNAENTIKDELKSATHFRRMVLEQALKELQYVRAIPIR